jgi:hypothetical protein
VLLVQSAPVVLRSWSIVVARGLCHSIRNAASGSTFASQRAGM